MTKQKEQRSDKDVKDENGQDKHCNIISKGTTEIRWLLTIPKVSCGDLPVFDAWKKISGGELTPDCGGL